MNRICMNRITCEQFENYLPSAAKPPGLKACSHPQRTWLRREQTCYAKRSHPFAIRIPYCLCPVDILLYRSSILKQPTGNAPASNMPFSPHPSRSSSRLPLKLTIQISPRVLDYGLSRWWGRPRVSFTVFVERQISTPQERIGYCAPLFIKHRIDICSVWDNAQCSS